jgi:carboxyl-terminal processing protease
VPQHKLSRQYQLTRTNPLAVAAKLEVLIMKKHILFGVVFAVPLLAVAQTQNPRSLFDFTAQVLQEEYVNPREFNIPEVVAKYKTQLDKVCQDPKQCTPENTKKLVQEMLGSFQDAHLKFFEDTGEAEPLGTSNPSGRFGFFGKANNKKFVITYIYPESPAESAGLQVGDQIVAVDGIEPTEIEKALRTKEVSYSETKLGVLSKGTKKEVLLRATDSRAYVSVSQVLQNNIRKIRVPEADLYQEQEFHNQIFKALESDTTALVLDLRNNAGGSSVASLKMAAAFFEKPGRIMVQRDGLRWIFEFNGKGISWRNAADPSNKGEFAGEVERVARFSGKVAILVSETTYSAGEHLVHLLQTSAKARVFGLPSAGALDSSAAYKKYPEGGILFYGINRYQDLTGQWLPPRVTPDELVSLDLDFLIQGRDTQLEAALRWLGQ